MATTVAPGLLVAAASRPTRLSCPHPAAHQSCGEAVVFAGYRRHVRGNLGTGDHRHDGGLGREPGRELAPRARRHLAARTWWRRLGRALRLFGVAIEAPARNQIVAIVVMVAWLVAAEQAIGEASARASVAGCLDALPWAFAVSEEGLLSMQAGAVVLIAWASAAFGAGLVRTLRGDIG